MWTALCTATFSDRGATIATIVRSSFVGAQWMDERAPAPIVKTSIKWTKPSKNVDNAEVVVSTINAPGALAVGGGTSILHSVDRPYGCLCSITASHHNRSCCSPNTNRAIPCQSTPNRLSCRQRRHRKQGLSGNPSAHAAVFPSLSSATNNNNSIVGDSLSVKIDWTVQLQRYVYEGFEVHWRNDATSSQWRNNSDRNYCWTFKYCIRISFTFT